MYQLGPMVRGVAAGVVCALFLWTASVHAFSVQPMSYVIEPAGSGSSITLRIENRYDQPLPIELFVEERIVADDGSETRRQADGDFTIFPPQAIVPPGKTQAVRVRYIGEPDIDVSKVYAVSVTQVPVGLEGQDSGVEVVFTFATAAHVVPPGAEARLRLEELKRGNGRSVATIANDGRRFAHLALGRWRVHTASGDALELGPEELQAFVGNPLLPPGGKRAVSIPWSAIGGAAPAGIEFLPVR